MALQEGLCVSSSTDFQISGEAEHGADLGTGDSARLAHRPWYPLLLRLNSCPPITLCRRDLLSQGPIMHQALATSQDLDLERRKFLMAEWSSRVIDTLMKVRKPSTNATYNRVWQQFEEFAAGLGFLALLWRFSMSWIFFRGGWTLDSAWRRSGAMPVFSGYRWTTHKLILHFFQAVKQTRSSWKLLFPPIGPSIGAGFSVFRCVPAQQISNLMLAYNDDGVPSGYHLGQ